ncbi:MAG: ATP-dependent helicase [Leptospirillum sp.]
MNIDELNPEQRDAVLHEGGALLVLAPAGSGKTRVVISRLLYLLERFSLPEDRIMAVTFTRKAAGELVSRIREARPGARLPWVGTFHAISARFLRENADRAGLPSSFTVMDGHDQRFLARNLLKLSGISEDEIDPKQLLTRISQWKMKEETPEKLLSAALFGPLRQMANLYAAYEKKLVENQVLDYDDLLIRSMMLLSSDPLLRSVCQSHFAYILVDEYQDTNPVQEKLLRLFSRDLSNITVVGDDDQSIYRFRGADVGHIHAFPKEYRNVKRVVLRTNYRSTDSIVQVAAALISKAPKRFEKDVVSTGIKGDPVELVRFSDERDEAESIAKRIRDHVAAGGRYSDHAVLFRMNAQAAPLEKAFSEHSIPYKVGSSGASFFDRREIRDLMAYFRVLVNPHDRLSLVRILNVPSRGLGEKAQERLATIMPGENPTVPELLKRFASESNPRQAPKILELAGIIEAGVSRVLQCSSLESIFSRLIADIGYREYLEALSEGSDGGGVRTSLLDELLALAGRFDQWAKTEGVVDVASRFLEETALSQDDSLAGESSGVSDRVSLLTIHQSKGLEFPHVVVCGMEEGILPIRAREATDVEEERRLFYVAMTRASKTLALTWCVTRQLFGRTQSARPSRFLFDLPPSRTCGDVPKRQDQVSSSVRPSSFAAGASGNFSPKTVPGKSAAPFSPVQSREKGEHPGSSAPAENRHHEKVGFRIRHARFGEGTVVSVTGSGPDRELSISFGPGNVKKMLERYANIEWLESKGAG